jgi:protein-disulfide isomerase
MASNAKVRSARVRRKLDQERAAKTRRLTIIGSVLAIAIIAASVLIYASSDHGGSGLPAIKAAAAEIDSSIPQDGRTMGDPNAPVTVIEYGDYQCPACAQAFQQIQPQLISDYVATGKVKFEFRDFAFLDRSLSLGSDGKVTVSGDPGESVTSAEAAAAAAAQGKFWAFHNLVYTNHNGENQGAYTRDRLDRIAELAGLDVDAFNQALDSQTYLPDVESMYAEAVQLGIQSTPSFVVNGKVMTISGYGDLKSAIDDALGS